MGLFPTHVGSVLASVKARPRLRLVRAYPRYYPSQHWIVKVPGLREVATWNCVMHLEKMHTVVHRAGSSEILT